MKYRVLNGINYRPLGSGVEVRCEVGDEVSDLSTSSAEALLSVGAIEAAGDAESDGAEAVVDEGDRADGSAHARPSARRKSR